MVAIVDYGVGNLFSLMSSFAALGIEAVATDDPATIRSADRIILPGVGAFGDASEKLFDSGLADIVLEQAEKGTPILGICLGMQLLFDVGYEYGTYKGLGLIKGKITPMAEVLTEGYKIPHIGWNSLSFGKEKSVLFKYLNEGDYVYFVHSYHATGCSDSIIASTEYGVDVTAAVASGNVFGCQFHPEKSGEVGLKILKAFCEIGAKE